MRRFVVTLAAVACAEPEGVVAPSCSDHDLAFVLGTGADAYEPLEDGQVVTPSKGGQGGWHLWTAVDVSWTSPQVSLASALTLPALGDQGLSLDLPPAFVALAGYDEADWSGVYYGYQARLDTSPEAQDALCDAGLAAACEDVPLICALAGQTLELCVTVTDLADQRSATACRDVVVDDDDDVGSCG